MEKEGCKIKNKKEIPTGIKIISILYYIFSAVFLMLSASVIFILKLRPFPDIIFTLVFLGLAILYFFIARGLKKIRNWARIVVIIFAVLGIVGVIGNISLENIINLIINIILLIIQGIIGSYLLFNKKVKEIFAKFAVYTKARLEKKDKKKK